MFYRNSILIKTIVSIIIIAAILLYIFLNSRVFIKGPQISVGFPENGQMIEDKLIYVTGQTTNSDFISINERVIMIDPKGYFKVPYLMLDGKNVIEIKVRDRFNRQATKKIEVVYNEDEDVLKKIEKIMNPKTELEEANDSDHGIDLDQGVDSDQGDEPNTATNTPDGFNSNL